MDREPKAARVLLENRHLLPTVGCALDLACGLGGNALLLAEHGLDTWAWDISEVAVARLQETATQQGLFLHAEVRDVSADPPGPSRFDVIVVSRFLDRHITSALVEALNPEGLLFYQTFTHHAADVIGPKNPAYLLDSQELLSLFEQLHVLVYRDEGRVGDLTQGLRHEALLVGKKAVDPA
jgi:2-polyprenyl-3-methyl-5-hydroxy-6-metoxy-1,4-benzoquinol methylase